MVDTHHPVALLYASVGVLWLFFHKLKYLQAECDPARRERGVNARTLFQIWTNLSQMLAELEEIRQKPNSTVTNALPSRSRDMSTIRNNHSNPFDNGEVS